MYNTLVFSTFVALVIFFVAIEIYRSKFVIKGVIVEFSHTDPGIDEFILARMQVRLQNGQVVQAEASHCTVCMGNLAVGDEVSLSRKDDRYIVNLPFKMKRSCMI